jgi:thiamine-phosphate pyrophosphorylase
MPIPQPLLVVTDRHQARQPLEDVVAEIVAAGARWIWFRDRDMESMERRQLALRLSDIVQSAGGRLSIGGDAALAAEVGTNAVHVRDASGVTEGRRLLGPAALVGMSAHGVADVENARAAGADYVTLSPIYETPSKPGYGPALGPEGIAIAASLGIPVLALGGITPDNALAVRHKGAAGIAIMGGVMRAASPREVVAGLLQRLGDTAGNLRSSRLASSTKV